MSNDRVGHWIQLKSGKPFWPLDPRPEEIDIRDIAWSLSMQCRFAGHSLVFYSVAEHSWLVSHAVPQDYALWGLLHDATEAYLQDLVRPIKDNLPNYRLHEDALMECIAQRFGLSWPMPAVVKEIDDRMLATEKQQILSTSERDWQFDVQPLPDVDTIGLSPLQARRYFMMRFRELTSQDHSSNASKARVDTKPIIDHFDWSQCKPGDMATCSMCKQAITYTGQYWDHQGIIKPRHPGTPDMSTSYRPITLVRCYPDDAITRASVRSPLPGDMAVCLHCNEQIRFNQFGKWEHLQGDGLDTDEAEPHPF